MGNIATVIGRGSWNTLKDLWGVIKDMDKDPYVKEQELRVNEYNTRKVIFEISLSEYAKSQGRLETDYITSDLKAVAGAANESRAKARALVKLHQQMPRGIDFIVEPNLVVQDNGEIGNHAYRVIAYGIGLKLRPDVEQRLPTPHQTIELGPTADLGPRVRLTDYKI